MADDIEELPKRIEVALRATADEAWDYTGNSRADMRRKAAKAGLSALRGETRPTEQEE